MIPPSPTRLATTNGATLPPPIRYGEAPMPPRRTTTAITSSTGSVKSRNPPAAVDAVEERARPRSTPTGASGTSAPPASSAAAARPPRRPRAGRARRGRRGARRAGSAPSAPKPPAARRDQLASERPAVDQLDAARRRPRSCRTKRPSGPRSTNRRSPSSASSRLSFVPRRSRGVRSEAVLVAARGWRRTRPSCPLAPRRAAARRAARRRRA